MMKDTRNSSLTPEEIRHILCAPEATDDLRDIDFEPISDEELEAERRYIESLLTAELG